MCEFNIEFPKDDPLSVSNAEDFSDTNLNVIANAVSITYFAHEFSIII